MISLPKFVSLCQKSVFLLPTKTSCFFLCTSYASEVMGKLGTGKQNRDIEDKNIPLCYTYSTFESCVFFHTLVIHLNQNLWSDFPKSDVNNSFPHIVYHSLKFSYYADFIDCYPALIGFTKAKIESS